MSQRAFHWLCLALAAACALTALAALATGPTPTSLWDIATALVGSHADSVVTAIVQDLRLPRVLLGLLLGAALAQAGVLMQAVFRNPLAEPGLVGVSSGAALAAVAIIVLAEKSPWLQGIPTRLLLPVATFAGGAAAVLLVVRLAQTEGHTRISTLLMAGLALNAIAGAGIGFLSHVASDQALRQLTFWLFGSLGKAHWPELLTAAPLLVLPMLLAFRDAQALNALLLGEAEAQHLGLSVERLKQRLLLMTVLLAGTAVALAGLVAFIGLIIPHCVRLMVGVDHRRVLPASVLLGAWVLLAADTAARTLFAPADLPIGILTALVGGPLFLALLYRQRPGGMA